MLVKQGELFRYLDLEFVKSITDLAIHLSCKQGERLFDIGDPAQFFYMLLKGSVKMERGDDQLYNTKEAGEIFGWSALIQRPQYAASATLVTDSEVLKFPIKPILELLEGSPKNKALLYEHLSRQLGNQLLEVYIARSC